MAADDIQDEIECVVASDLGEFQGVFFQSVWKDASDKDETLQAVKNMVTNRWIKERSLPASLRSFTQVSSELSIVEGTL